MPEILQQTPEPELHEIEAAHASPEAGFGLGREAVKADIMLTEFKVSGMEGLVEKGEFHRGNLAQRARNRIDALSYDQRKIADDFISAQPDSAWLDAALGVDANKKGVKNYTEKLTRKSRAGKYRVGNELFQNFLEWHNHALAEKQHEMDAQREDYEKDFKNNVEQAVREGFIPEYVLERLDQRLANTRFIVDDGFSTSIYDEGGGIQRPRDGEYIIAVAPNHAEAPEHAITHELIHVMQGEEALPQDEINNERPAESTGLYRVFGKGGRILNEAIVEHLAHGLLNGKIAETNPESAIRHGAVYPGERAILHWLSTQGSEPVDIRLFSEALFEDGDQGEALGENSAGDRLLEQLNKSFPGLDIVTMLSNLNSRN